MNKIISSLLALSLSVCSLVLPVKADPVIGRFVAVISSPDVRFYFDNNLKWGTDYITSLYSWDDLDSKLEQIKENAHGQPIYLDMLVHGGPSGLAVKPNFGFMRHDRASMGFVLNHIEKHLGTKNLLLSFESCYAGDAYRNTIRGAKMESIYDNVEDHNSIPNYPIYGVGQGYSNIGPICYIQVRHRFHRYLKDLRQWDKKGINKPMEPLEKDSYEGLSPSTENILYIYEFFSDHID